MTMMDTSELYFVRLKRNGDNDVEVFVARPKYISADTICFVSRCNEINTYVSDTHMYSIPRVWVEFYFKMSDLIEGRRYRFVDKNDNTYVAELVSYANYHLDIKVDDEAGITSMVIFHMRSIHFIHF